MYIYIYVYIYMYIYICIYIYVYAHQKVYLHTKMKRYLLKPQPPRNVLDAFEFGAFYLQEEAALVCCRKPTSLKKGSYTAASNSFGANYYCRVDEHSQSSETLQGPDPPSKSS